jgi:hypothetical protein
VIIRPNSTGRFADLLSQLEESKFVRLFRHLASTTSDENYASGPNPSDLANAEVQVMTQGASRYSDAESHLFQIAHLPVGFWSSSNMEAFIEASLTAAFTDLRGDPRLVESLSGLSMADATKNTWPPEWSKISSYYFLVTNVCGPALLSEDCERYTELAHRLFEQIVGLERRLHPAFGVGNPEVFAEKAPKEVEQFVIDLINSPSSYYLIAREGRISVIPVTEHGQYATGFLRAKGGVMTPDLAVATSTLMKPQPITSGMLSQFEDLLNSRGVKERDIQEFLKAHPEILFSLDEHYCEIRPHVCLYDLLGNRLIPDFMVRLENSRLWHVIELKLPHEGITVCNGDMDQLSAQAARGVAELLRYRDVFSTRDSRDRAATRLGIAPYEPCLVMVIGRGHPKEKMRWFGPRAGIPNVEIVSYDYLFERARACRQSIRADIQPS